MLAARDRAAGSAARAAILRGDSAADGPGSTAATSPAATAPGATATGSGAGRPRREPAEPRPAAAAPPPAATPPPAAKPPPASTPAAADSADTLARLREAKKRARGD